MANLDIKEYARQKKVKLWQVAMAMGMQDSNFSRKLRTELSQEEKEKIIAIIDNLASREVDFAEYVICSSCGKKVINKRFCCECGKFLSEKEN